LVARALRIGLVVAETTVRVNNYWKTFVIPWAEIEGVGIHSPAAAFRNDL
jgi:hypothetical protein